MDEETHQTINQINQLKAPKPDGIHAIFYKKKKKTKKWLVRISVSWWDLFCKHGNLLKERIRHISI